MTGIGGYSFIILGCGPIGGIFATSVASRAEKTAVVDAWREHADKIRTDGLKVVIDRNTRTTKFQDVFYSIDDIVDFSYDYLVVSLKTPIMERVIPPAADSIPERVKIISLQNGIGTEDFLAKHFGPERVFRVVVNYAGTSVGPGVVEQTFFHSPNYIGACSDESFSQARTLADFLTSVDMTTEFSEAIKNHEWRKAAMNVAMSSVSALTSLNMKEVMSHDITRQLVIALLQEVMLVGKNDEIDFGNEYFDQSLKYLDDAGPHMPSMRTDLDNNRETEINFLNQKILDVALSLNAHVPFLECITSLIRGCEMKNKNRS